MNREDIIRMAREAGAYEEEGNIEFDEWEMARFVRSIEKRVAAAEREECAKLCDEQADEHAQLQEFYELAAVETLAEAIRARGKE